MEAYRLPNGQGKIEGAAEKNKNGGNQVQVEGEGQNEQTLDESDHALPINRSKFQQKHKTEIPDMRTNSIN